MGEPTWRSRGYLPHHDAPAGCQHIVFGLADALSIQMAARAANAPPWARLEVVEAALDAGHGRRILASPCAARIVQDALLHFDAARYHLLAWCVMPTHVHSLVVLVEPWSLARIIHTWKSFTANAVNRALGLSGRLWAREYFDRMIRDEAQLDTVRAYIENNRVARDLAMVERVSRADLKMPAGSRRSGG